MSDFHVTITVRNGPLLRAIRSLGFPSISAFAQHHNLRYSSVSQYLCLKLAPYKPDSGRPRIDAVALADALGMAIDDLFPPAFLRRTLARNTLSLEMTQEQIEGMALPPATPERALLQGEAGARVRELLTTLKPRERLVLEHRFGLNDKEQMTLEDVSKIIGTNKERVRQIESRALRRLSHPAHVKTISDLAEDAIFADC